MRIVVPSAAEPAVLEAMAELALEAAAQISERWLPSLARAREEVAEALGEGRRTRIAVSPAGEVAGWISCFHTYGDVWEIHPLLVAPRFQGQGIGARLVGEAERLIAAEGAGVIIVGTSDEVRGTSASGRDLYADLAGALATFTASPSHPAGFWLKMGYTLVGFTPDAEGPGMPSINFAKRPARDRRGRR
ncbi:MAG: GNAT family N-acetyltransferase [Myxococcales bacterium]|nr:GNAT family N-acetyltransferase [Myxococcales bacterium]